MAPGTWAQLTVPNQNSILGVGAHTGSMIPFSNSMPWNPISKVIEIIGMDHYYVNGLRHVRYDPATNQFVLVQEGIDGTGPAHGYDHNTINPYTGDIYHRVYSTFSGNISSKKRVLGSSGFVDIPKVPAVEQVAIGTTWWSGPFVGGGSQGSYMVFNSGNANGTANDGQIVAYNPQTNAWFYNKTGQAPFYGSGSTYHSVMEYSPQKNVAVYGGGNVAPNKLWRLSANGTVVAMPDVPAGKAVGMQAGNLVNDPVTGNFLLLSAGELWELNPDGAGSWTRQTSPPSGVGNPQVPDHVISSAISDYGVVAYITQNTSTGGTFYLYKHAASGLADTTAPTVSLTAPAAGTVSGTVTLTANASDNTGVAGVQFKLDGVNLAAEDTVAPYTVTWDSTTAANGAHTLTAVARDTAGNLTTSDAVVVTVTNPVNTVPNAFSFTSQTGIAPSTVVTSNTITPTGYNAATAISVSAGGSYSINGGAFVTTSGTLNPGQTVAVRQTSSASNSTTTTVTLTIGGVAGSYAVTTTAPGAVVSIGEPNVLATFDNGNANLLLAQSTTLAQSATIQSLSFYVTAAAGNLRLGIYDATGPGGGPGAKVAETPEITPIVGWNTANVVTPASLSAGIYWLAYLPSSNSLGFQKTVDATSSAKFYSVTYGAMPVTFSTAPNNSASHWSFYGTLIAGTATPDTTPDAFSFTARSGAALNTVVTSNTITPTGYNTAAAISVGAGASYSINGGAFVTTGGTLSPGQTVAVRLTTAAGNNTQTCATLTVGGVSGQFCATTVAPGQAIIGGQDFTTRCAQPGVVKCVGFDDVADFNIGNGGTSGAYGKNSGIFPPSGTSDYTRAVQDTSVKASGAGSLRFTIPTNTSSDTSGSYFTNFSSDLSVQFGAGEEFYVQWRQRFSPEFINTVYEGANGWKQIIVGTGDQPAKLYFSCTTLELPVQNSRQRRFPQMYNSCTGSTSHGAYNAFEEPYGPYDFKLQNARAAPYCLYHQDTTGYFAPNGNCFGYVANEWMTFQMKVQIGPRVGDEFQGSYITLWGAREGQPSELLIQYGPYNLSAGSLAENQRYGKVWLLPYNTNKSSAQVHPAAYTWYDELIISRNKIEDPPLTQGQVPTTDTTPDAFSFTAQTGVAPGTVVTSNTITPAGYNAATTVSVSGGSYSINGGAFVTTAGTISPGQSVALRMTASSTFGTIATAALTIGGVTGTFAVTTTPTALDNTTPTNISATASNASIILRFTAPASSGTPAITGFTATCSSSNGGRLGVGTGPANATEVRVTGLTNGKTYTCAVVANTSAGTGLASVSSKALTPFDMTPIQYFLLND
jgi:hypothetical protein